VGGEGGEGDAVHSKRTVSGCGGGVGEDTAGWGGVRRLQVHRRKMQAGGVGGSGGAGGAGGTGEVLNLATSSTACFGLHEHWV